MARGWESKAIEDQISAAEARQEGRAKVALTAQELERQQRRKGLLLERTRISRQLQEAHNERYRALLERALTHLEAELAEVDKFQPPQKN